MTEAYFVTAKDANGEGPRSNVITWNCDVEGGSSARLRELAAPEAKLPIVAPDLENQSCAIDEEMLASATSTESKSESETFELLTLGQSVVNPPYAVLDLFVDHLGSTRVVGRPNQTIDSMHDYFPFGEETTPMVSRTTHMFTGHERDAGSGLDYMLARYYSSGLGRFASADPSRKGVIRGLTTSWNLYTYVYNNPLRLVDRFGLTPTFTYAEGTGQATRSAVERYAQTSSIQQIPRSVTVRVGNNDNIVITQPEHAQAGEATTGSVALGFSPDDGKLVQAEVEIDETAAGPGGARRSEQQISGDVGEELGHIVDGWKHPEEAANPSDPRDKEALEERKKMDEELKQKEKDKTGGGKNEYGIDPDGPYGPQPNPCQGRLVC